MNTDILLLSVDSLKKNSTIDYNVEDKILESSILDAQNIDIQNIIGTTLYNEILSQVSSGTINDVGNADYKILLDAWIFPTHLKYSLYRSIMPMRVSFRNKGLMELSGGNSQPIDKEFINYVENKIKNDVEFYATKLTGYLHYFFGLYPTMQCEKPDNRNDYNEPKKGDSYFTGIYL